MQRTGPQRPARSSDPPAQGGLGGAVSRSEASTWGRWKGVGRTEAGSAGVPRLFSNNAPSPQPRPLIRAPQPRPPLLRFLGPGNERTLEPNADPGSNPDSATHGAWPPGATGPRPPSCGRVGAWKRRLPARSSPAGSSVSLFSLVFFFFIPSSLASFSSRLRNPGQTAAFSNPSRPPGAQRASPLPRPAPRPERRPGPGRPHAVVPDLNLRASVGEGCCRPQPIGGAGQLGPPWALPRLAGGGRCPLE